MGACGMAEMGKGRWGMEEGKGGSRLKRRMMSLGKKDGERRKGRKRMRMMMRILQRMRMKRKDVEENEERGDEVMR